MPRARPSALACKRPLAEPVNTGLRSFYVSVGLDRQATIDGFAGDALHCYGTLDFAWWLPREIGAFVGGTAFLMIPQLMAFFLLIGFKSGVMPMRGGKAARKDDPISFWLAASCYGGLLAFTLWFILTVLADIARHGLN